MLYKYSNIQTYPISSRYSRESSIQQSKTFHNLIFQSSFIHHVLMEDCYINVKNDSRFLCKTISLFVSYVEFFKVWLYWSRSIHTIDAYTYVISSTGYPHLRTFLIASYLKSVIYAVLALTKLPLQISGVWTHNFLTPKLEL